MDNLKLFEFIQRDNDDGKIINQLKQHAEKGEKLEWFQDVIPGLIPGVDESQSWLHPARELLWTPTQHSENKTKIDRMKKLQQPSPKPLIEDRYRLRRHWAAYVEALRPMTKRMQEAANEVYHVVAGQDCVSDDQNVARLTSETDDKHHTFVAIAMTLQDKVLNPIIDDIERRQKTFTEEAERTKGQTYNLKTGLRHDDDDEGQVTSDESQLTADEVEHFSSGHRDSLSEEMQEGEALLKALVRFRDILVVEKDERDRRRDLKRDGKLEQPDSAEVRPRKRAKVD